MSDTPHVVVPEAIAIDPTSPVPAYYQLYESLRAQLGSDRMPAGAKLATERAIAELLGVGRQTVRQALARLEREGLVTRRQGDGTYISEPRVESALRSVSGFTSELGARGLRVRSRVLDLRRTRPPGPVAAELGVDARGETAVMLRRTRLLDGVPAALETVWMPAVLCAPLLEVDMTDRSLYATLRDVLGIHPAHATERLTATVLDDFEAGELGQRRGDPALLVERTTRDTAGRQFETVKSVLRADRFSFRAELDLESEQTSVPTATAVELR
ncbi:MAG TPA: GntR family transcriptional regulator [Pseudolysinimonas sp.]|nr:GntR family transcriptional regulator [Pseudolysinimonas sp.]